MDIESNASAEDLQCRNLVKNVFRYARGFPSDPFVLSSNNSDILNPSALPYTHGLTGVNITLDQRLIACLWMSITFVFVLMLLLRAWQLANCHLRHIYCLSTIGSQQNYWKYEKSKIWPWLKREVIHAPLWKKRHNKEIQLSTAFNYGTLPGRLHMLLLLAYVLSNAAFCALLDYGNQNKAALFAELRGRSGILATVNLIPLIALSSRNNPAIPLLKVSFDTFNLFHRWIGRIVVLESAVHLLAWYVNYSAAKGQNTTSDTLMGSLFLQYGLISMLALAIISIQSISAIRHAFYETFLHLHQFLACTAIIGLYFHLSISNLPALIYARIVIGLWVTERIVRMTRIIYLNTCRQNGRTSLIVEVLPGEACRLTFQLPKRVLIQPGSHVYVYIPRIALWMSHPFSVAWTNLESDHPLRKMLDMNCPEEPKTPNSLEKQASQRHTRRSNAPSTISLVVAARTGMTRKLYDRALQIKDGTLKLSAFLEGPYGGHDVLASYGTVIMFAGGAGITHHLIQIRHLLAGASVKVVATRKITLIWSVRDVEALTWVRPWMDEILKMEGRKDILKVILYVTGPHFQADYRSSHQTIQSHQGRCVPSAILDEELPSRVGATMVTVCGPGAFADEVRAAVRKRLRTGCIDMNEESFTW